MREAHAEDGEVKQALGDGSFRGVAIHRATALMLDEARVAEALTLRFLPWLLGASPSDSLAVLKVGLVSSLLYLHQRHHLHGLAGLQDVIMSAHQLAWSIRWWAEGSHSLSTREQTSAILLLPMVGMCCFAGAGAASRAGAAAAAEAQR